MEQLELLYAVVDGTTDALYAKDREGRYIFANRATAAIFERTVEEVLGHTDTELFGAETGRRIAERDHRVFQTGVQEVYEETTHVAPSGTRRTYFTTKDPLRDAEGVIVAVVGVSRDITWVTQARAERAAARRERDQALADLRAAHDALRVSEERFRLALDAATTVTVAEQDTDLRYTWVYNAQGIPPEKILGFTDEQLYPSDTGTQMMALKRAVVESGVGFHRPMRIPLGDNRPDLAFDLAVQARRGKQGQITGLHVAAIDHSEREKSDFARRTSEERFRAFIERGRDIIAVLETDGTIRYLSPGIERVLGYHPDELRGVSCFTLIHPDDLPAMQEVMMTFANAVTAESPNPIPVPESGTGIRPTGKDTDSFTYRFRHHDGSFRVLESVGSNQRRNPAIEGIVVNSRDVTERVRLQEQLIQSGKLAALGELVAGVAHEINNPLAAISGLAQLMLLAPDTPASLREDAGAIQAMVTRASRIMASLKAFARAGEGGAANRRPYPVRPLLESALSLVIHRLRDTEIEIYLDAPDDLPLLPIDAGEIEQVLVNLLTNAEHALCRVPSSPRRRITMTATAAAPSTTSGTKTCTIVVEDTGPGIPPDILPRIFDPFFTTKRQGEGTGLGLYLSYGIVAAHGGTLTAANIGTEEGRISGARFTLTLPTNDR